jgi:transcriptional regulator with XRE-family HTH domain
LLDHRLDLSVVGDVATDGEDAMTLAGQILGSGVQCCLINVGQRHRGPGSCERLRCREAEPRPGTCHEGDFILEGLSHVWFSNSPTSAVTASVRPARERRKPAANRTFGSVRMSDEERRSELRRFLADRRARVNPADVGIVATGRRRVRGLRREEVASLAGIGVSWYTALESGEARGVSEATILAVSDALGLTDSERNYLLALTGRLADETLREPSPLLTDTLAAIAFPAYIVTASWDILAGNTAFRRVWEIADHELPCNAVERLFVDPRARRMHGEHFAANIAPVVAMLRSGLARRPSLVTLRRLRELLLADDATRKLWEGFEISDPFIPNTCTIESSIGTFAYEALTLSSGAPAGIVVQVPDQSSRARLAAHADSF